MTSHTKDRKVTGNSQYGFSEDKSCLTSLISSCEMTGSVNKGSAMHFDKEVKHYRPRY